MTDKPQPPRRRPRPAALERRDAARSAKPTTPTRKPTTPAERTSEAPATKPAIAGWRQRLYRIPIIGTIAYVIWPPRRSPSLIRRGVSTVLAVVAILGIGMAAYPWQGQNYPGFYRVPVEKLIEWSNFLSDMQTNRLQDELAKEFANLKALGLKEGDPLTRIEIPKLGVDTIVVQGTSPSALRAGAGHYPSTPLPGAAGNVAIAGHRTTYGRPFNQVDALQPKDTIILTTPIGRYTYAVSKAPFITHPFDWTIIAKSKEPILTLTTCHPKGSARQRLIVRAKLIKKEPVAQRAA
jgi:LPXTG-site transpeptidase (sortase) family protein